MPPVFRHDEVRRFVEHEKPIEIAPLDGDAMVGDVGEPADARILEAGYQRELGRHLAAERENLPNHGPRVIEIHAPMARRERLEELVLEAADGGTEIAGEVGAIAGERHRIAQPAACDPRERRRAHTS